MTTASSIKNNAVISIRLAVDDYKTGDPVRTISALRNITAGILLLYKEKLLRLSPPDSGEVLIKTKILPKLQNGKLVFVGTGTHTVDTGQIEQRFESLNIKADWRRTKEIIKLRNDIEHYHSNQPPSVLREVIGTAFSIINDFCSNELDVDPYELFDADVWGVFLEEKEILKSLHASLDEVNCQISWLHPEMKKVARNFVCSGCGSRLLRATNPQAHYQSLEFQCLTCRRENLFDELIGNALHDAYYSECYSTFKDIGEYYLELCEKCERVSFIPSEGYCAVCGDTAYKVCDGCESRYAVGHYCEYCDFRASEALGNEAPSH